MSKKHGERRGDGKRKGKKGRTGDEKVVLKDVVWRERDVRIWSYPPEGCLLALRPWLLKR